jgi:ELWxxDGT repeat protein
MCLALASIASIATAQVPRPLGSYQAAGGPIDYLGPLATLGEIVLFSARTQDAGLELWRSDGTPAGTRIVKDISPGPADSYLTQAVVVAGIAYFGADDGVHGGELWRSDGTDIGTFLLADIKPGPGGSTPLRFGSMGGQVFFTADDGQSGLELWVSDGTLPGTHLVKDIAPGGASSIPPYYDSTWNLATFEGRMYFRADDGSRGPELWSTDGSEAGTAIVKDIAPVSIGSYPHSLVALGQSLLFWASDSGTTEDSLWRTDGTDAGTFLLYSLRSTNERPVVAGGMLYFAAWATGFPSGLWRTDGTPAGTLPLQSPTGPNWPDLEGLSTVGKDVYFFLYTTSSTIGFTLWRLDGTTYATTRVKDFPEWGGGIGPGGLTPTLLGTFFRGKDLATQDELWRTDGTESGTRMVSDLAIGPRESRPENLTGVGSRLFFLANDDGAVPRLWSLGGPQSFFTLNPCRLIDTRMASGPLGGPALVAGLTRTFKVVEECGIPVSARALSLNVTLVAADAPGHLVLHPSRTPMPATSVTNYSPGVTRANNLVSEIDHLGNLDAVSKQATGTVHLIVDVNGYYE